jgi:phosphoesterase RecJ-like protein
MAKVPDSDSSFPNFETSLKGIVSVLNDGGSFLITTHRDPDADGIGSMLALGKTLLNVDKDVVLWTEAPVPPPNNRLKGADSIVQYIDPERDFDVVVVLDCAEIERAGQLQGNPGKLKPLINIDHHETNGFFGDLNLVDVNSSSTGELIFKVIKLGGFPIDRDVAGNIFAAIQADTGSFRYDNTSPTCLRIAAEMMDYGASPWKISREVMDGYNLSRLRLLEMALGTLEFHHAGKIGMMTILLEMFSKAGAGPEDSERFVDYPRFVSGVEIAVLIRQTGENDYKFSLRSNSRANVAQLASRFGGGGHAKAAGIDCHGSIGPLKEDFLREAVQLLDGIPN